MSASLVGSEMCIRDRFKHQRRRNSRSFDRAPRSSSDCSGGPHGTVAECTGGHVPSRIQTQFVRNTSWRTHPKHRH
eukprot:319269-Alexandrium_andersonii.AAC.1